MQHGYNDYDEDYGDDLEKRDLLDEPDFRKDEGTFGKYMCNEGNSNLNTAEDKLIA